MIDSTRPPSVGAVCQGAWKQVGESTYRLNRFALGYGGGVNLTSVYRFRDVVTVGPSGDKFFGTFTIDDSIRRRISRWDPRSPGRSRESGEDRYDDRLAEVSMQAGRPCRGCGTASQLFGLSRVGASNYLDEVRDAEGAVEGGLDVGGGEVQVLFGGVVAFVEREAQFGAGEEDGGDRLLARLGEGELAKEEGFGEG